MNHETKPWLKKRWPYLVIGGIALLALLFSVSREVGILGTLKLYGKEKQLLAENAKLREENERLRLEVENLRSNPSYIEEIARRELGLMDKKEIVIPLDRKSDAPSPPAHGSGSGRP